MNDMIYETIVTSVNEDGSCHLAPFGISEGGDSVVISPYQPSTSLNNLLREKTAVVNLTDDVRVYAGSVTGHRDWPVRSASKIKGYILDGVLAHRELYLTEVIEHETRPRLIFQIVYECNHLPFRGFNRAQAAVIEAAILTSRLNMLSKEKIDAELEYLAIAMEKTAGEREWQAWRWLLEEINNSRTDQVGDHQA